MKSTVGREAEMAQIAAFVERVHAGRGAALVIEGDPGIGKSHVVSHAISVAERAGLRVLQTTAREIEQEVPFAAAMDALGPEVRKQIAAVVPTGIQPGPELRFRITEVLVDKVDERLVDGPALLVFDDLHWADPSTLLFIERLRGSLDVSSLGIVVSVRPVPRSRDLEGLIADLAKYGLRLTLPPLDPTEVQRLSEAILGTRVGGRLLALLEKCGGNPFYVQEMLKSLEPTIETERGVSDTDADDLRTSLYETIVDRLAFLPEETLSLIRRASLLGTGFALDDLVVASDLSGMETLDVLAPAIRSGVLALDRSEASFRHDLVRDAFYCSIPEGARGSLHRDLVSRFLRAGRPPSSIAPHVLVSAQEGDEDGLDILRRAATDAASKAPGLAADLLARAVDIAGRTHPERFELEVELARALVWAGRAQEAERLSRRLLAERRGGTYGSVVRRAFLDALFLQGTLGRSLDAIETVILADAGPPHERAPILARAAGAYVVTGDLVRGEELAREVLRLAERTRDDASLSAALTALARIAHVRGEVRREKDLLERAAALALGGAGPSAAVEAPPVLAHLMARLEGRTEHALGLLRDGLELVERGGLVWAAWWMHTGIGVVLYQSGRLDDAASSLETALRVADEAGTRLLMPAIAAHLAHIEALRGDIGRAERHLSFADEESRRQSDSNIAADFDVLWARASVDELSRNDERALVALETLRKRAVDGPRNLLIDYVRFAPTHVRVATRLRDEKQAQGAVHTVEQGVALIRDGFPIEPWTSAYVDLCAGIAGRDGDLLIESCNNMRSVDRPLLLALAVEEAGRVVACSEPSDGIVFLKEARDLWSKAGAVAKVRGVDAELRRLGVRGPYRGRSNRPRRGWDALTDTEARVADLVAEGLTYRAIGERLFISKRTVETHVAHLFEKLNVSSRAEVAAQVSLRGRARE